MKLSPQKQRLYNLFEDGMWHCSVEILFIRDYRKRISEMLTEGFIFESQKCEGICKTKHASNVHKYRLVDTPKREVWEYDLVDGMRKPRLTYV